LSTLRTDNFGPSAGGTTYSARGIAKAWANLNGTGTIALRDSQNVSSVTDNGTGQYAFSFTTAFAAADYAGLIGSNSISGTGNTVANSADSGGYLAGSLSAVVTLLSGGTLNDVAFAQMSAHGDLA